MKQDTKQTERERLLNETTQALDRALDRMIGEVQRWHPIDTAPSNEFVLVACRSGYLGIEWIVTTAKYTKGYHDRWDDEGNDGLMDRGLKPEYWMELPPPPLKGDLVRCSHCERNGASFPHYHAPPTCDKTYGEQRHGMPREVTDDD